ncbi:MAG TPA: hypothetical protein VEC57_15605 [Candidatus Limnocylindrales bacterium]|nr:hypothetical protein [Candidatus Limnocylindrales bacterium]
MTHTALSRITALAILLAATSASAHDGFVGANHAGSVADCTFGSGCSSAAGNADSACASSTGAQFVSVAGFGFDLPASATSIDGFAVEPKIADLGCQGTIQLVKDGTPVGTPKSLPSYYANSCDLTQYFYLGAADDGWGTTWTLADVEDADFGVRIDSNGCSGVAVDTVRVTVFFTIGTEVCNDGYVTGGETCEDGNTAGGDGCSADCRAEVALNDDQQDCVNAVNKGMAGIFKTANKAYNKCLKAYAKDGSDFLACAGAPKPQAKIQKAIEKVAALAEPCDASAPHFGYTDAAQAASFTRLISELIYDNLVDDFPEDFVVGDKAAFACQSAVLTAQQAVTGGVFNSFNKCKKAALLGKKVTQATTGEELAGCLTPQEEDAEAGLLGALDGKCAGQPLDELINGTCTPSASNQARAECLTAVGRCFACSAVVVADGLDVDCDIFDNGADDESCPE